MKGHEEAQNECPRCGWLHFRDDCPLERQELVEDVVSMMVGPLHERLDNIIDVWGLR